MNIFPHPPRDRVLQLLAQCDLPWSDLAAPDLEYFLGCGDKSAPNGIIGLERHGEDALLRSLAVCAECRNSGCATALVCRLEELAQSNGVRELCADNDGRNILCAAWVLHCHAQHAPGSHQSDH